MLLGNVSGVLESFDLFSFPSVTRSFTVSEETPVSLVTSSAVETEILYALDQSSEEISLPSSVFPSETTLIVIFPVFLSIAPPTDVKLSENGFASTKL